MANYSLVVDSKFKPFSYDELVAPVLMATQAHQELENQYGELSAKASVWEEMANEQTDPYAYKMYKTYANDLEEQAGQLAREGLNAASRRDMLNMRARYNKEIIPIEEAFKARQEEAKAQYEGRSKGLIYEGDAATSSLDRYLGNPSIRYNYANSVEGFNRVSTVASALAKGLRDYGNGKKLDSYTKTWLQEHGYKDTDIAAAIADVRNIINGDTNVESNGVLREILNDEMNTAGINTWTNQDAINDYFDRVAPALYKAVGETKVSPYENYGAKLWAQNAGNTPEPPAYTRHYRSIGNVTVDGDKETTQMAEDIKFLREIQKNPKILEEVTKGREAFENPMMYSASGGLAVPMYGKDVFTSGATRLKEIADRYGLAINYNMTTDDKGNITPDTTLNGKDTFEEAVRYLESEIRKSAIRSNTYIVDITDPSLISSTILENSAVLDRNTGNTGIYEMKDGKKGDLVDMSEVLEYFSGNEKGVNISYQPGKGIIYTGVNSSGEKKDFLLDPEVVAGETVGEGESRVNMYQQVMNDIDSSIEEGNTVLTDTGIDRLMNDMYYRFNSKSKKQGMTLSSSEEKVM